jgi:hypothetical protein
MDIQTFSLPNLTEGQETIERLYCQLINKYRNGDKLNAEELDWMDSANVHLITSGDNL